jgi:hypothetical protein
LDNHSTSTIQGQSSSKKQPIDPDAKLQLEGEGDLVEADELDIDKDSLPLFDTKGRRHTG